MNLKTLTNDELAELWIEGPSPAQVDADPEIEAKIGVEVSKRGFLSARGVFAPPAPIETAATWRA